MKVEQKIWTQQHKWSSIHGGTTPINPNLVLYFGKREVLLSHKIYEDLKKNYPNAHILGCSTGGEISGSETYDDSACSMAMEFEHTQLKTSKFQIDGDSYEVGIKIAQELNQPGLKAIFTLSDGLEVNGSEFVRGIKSIVGKEISISGGLAGDGDKFKETIVGCNESPQRKTIAAVGFYGDRCRIGTGSGGGWKPFGPERLITKSKGNILYELDNKPALSLYKQYLGDKASQLPASALLFPLAIRPENYNGLTVRTILSVNEDDQSMTFAGDVPQGYVAYLMNSNAQKLVQGAEDAAQLAIIEGYENSQVSILISCIGRKLLLGQRIGDETEAVQNSMGTAIPQIGFYSYGEISPHAETGWCELHNQTMTITNIAEV